MINSYQRRTLDLGGLRWFLREVKYGFAFCMGYRKFSISIGVFVHITCFCFYAVIMQESQTILAEENLTSVVHNDKHMFDRHRQIKI